MNEQPAQDFDASPTDVVDRLAAAQDADLRAALAGLSQLAASQIALAEMLRRVAEFAVRAIPGADGAGLTIMDNGTPGTVVVTDPFVERVDEIQYSLGEGPCLSAAAERRAVRSGSLGDDRSWPRFGQRVARMGVHSALSMPLVAADEVVGAINIYARAHEAFDERAEVLAQLYAVAAAVSVQTAEALAQARALAEQLENALGSHAVVDQAIGVLISRTGCTHEQAFEKLRAVSQTQNKRLTLVAQKLIDDAMRRARARADQR